MAWLTGDSMQLYASQADAKRRWSQVDNITFPTTGPRGGRCMLISHINHNYLSFENDSNEMVAGFRYYNQGGSWLAARWFSFVDGTGTIHLTLNTNSDGTIDVVRNTTVLETTSFAMALATWYYVELKGTIDNAGSYELRIGQGATNAVMSTIASASGVDTQNGGDPVMHQVILSGQNSRPTRWADLYVLNQTVDPDNPNVNNFLGDVVAEGDTCDAVGNSNDFTRSPAVDPHLNLDEIGPDDDTTRVESGVLDDKTDVRAEDVDDIDGGIVCVQWVGALEKDDSGPITARAYLGVGGTDYEDTNGISPTMGGYPMWTRPFTSNPASGALWELTDRQGLRLGLKIQSVG